MPTAEIITPQSRLMSEDEFISIPADRRPKRCDFRVSYTPGTLTVKSYFLLEGSNGGHDGYALFVMLAAEGVKMGSWKSWYFRYGSDEAALMNEHAQRLIDASDARAKDIFDAAAELAHLKLKGFDVAGLGPTTKGTLF